jgi:tRNA-dependent cyclodipeptide synthase
MAIRTLDQRLMGRIELFNREAFSNGWQIQIQLADDTQILRRGVAYLRAGLDILLPLCLNNGYYNRENIYRMLKFTTQFSKDVHVFATDGPAKHNYRALGKAEGKISTITRLARNRLRNLCAQALRRINANLPEDQHHKIMFLEWNDIYHDPVYVDSYRTLKELYTQSTEFKKDADSSSKRVLLSRIGLESEVTAKLSIGIEYIIEELAFILAYRSLSLKSKRAANYSNSRFSYLYYEPWPIFEKLVNGDYDNKPKQGIGFVIAKIHTV